jgi:hypothetical protein
MRIEVSIDSHRRIPGGIARPTFRRLFLVWGNYHLAAHVSQHHVYFSCKTTLLVGYWSSSSPEVLQRWEIRGLRFALQRGTIARCLPVPEHIRHPAYLERYVTQPTQNTPPGVWFVCAALSILPACKSESKKRKKRKEGARSLLMR